MKSLRPKKIAWTAPPINTVDYVIKETVDKEICWEIRKIHFGIKWATRRELINEITTR